MSNLLKYLGKKFVYTTEIIPPRAADLEPLNKEIIKLDSRITAVFVPDLPGASLYMNSLVCSIQLRDRDIEPVYQINCRDRNSLAIESNLLAAHALGIVNVSALTGEHPMRGDHRNLKTVYELDSMTLLKTIDYLNRGRDIAGNRLIKKTGFFMGSDLSVHSKPSAAEMYKTRKKITLGAGFFHTWPVYSVNNLKRFLNEYRELFREDLSQKTIVGLQTLTSIEQVNFLRRQPNHRIPTKTVKRIRESGNPREEGIQLTLEWIDKIKELNPAGIHLFSAGDTELTGEILNRV